MAKKKAAKTRIAKTSHKGRKGPAKTLTDEVVDTVKGAVGTGKAKRKK